MQFGFALLEGVEVGINKRVGKFEGLLGAEELGSQMLKSSFEVHDMARKEVRTRFLCFYEMNYHAFLLMDQARAKFFFPARDIQFNFIISELCIK